MPVLRINSQQLSLIDLHIFCSGTTSLLVASLIKDRGSQSRILLKHSPCQPHPASYARYNSTAGSSFVKLSLPRIDCRHPGRSLLQLSKPMPVNQTRIAFYRIIRRIPPPQFCGFERCCHRFSALSPGVLTLDFSHHRTDFSTWIGYLLPEGEMRMLGD